VNNMPSRDSHKKISRYVTGDSCDLTHAIIDYPVRYLGRKHQILFHDPLSAFLIGFFADGYNGAISGLLHIGADYINKGLGVKKGATRNGN